MVLRILPVLLLLCTPAAAQEFIAERIAAANPCGGLEVRQTVLGTEVAVGLTELTEVAIARASIHLEAQTARLEVAGRIGCRTGTTSILQGDALLGLTVSAEVSLDSCEVASLSLTPGEYGGSLGGLLESAWPDIVSPALQEQTRRLLSQGCTDVTAASAE